MTYSVFLLLFLFVNDCSVGQYVTADRPTINQLSAMCSSEGITASILFDRPFNGRIYSLNYATIHDCVYYSGYDLDNILFSIPAHRCGTRLTRTTRNMVDQMENHVYVQMEKDAQTAADRQFLFVCQLADARIEKEPRSDYDIRRHPIVGSSSATGQEYPLAPDTKKTPAQIRMWTYPEPVKSNTVPRVSAYSSDGHLGNWPIPGARPYSPSVTPESSWPRQPLPEPIVPQTTTEHYVAAIALSEGGGKTNLDTYGRVGTHPSLPTTPRNPFLSPVLPPVADQRTKTDDFLRPAISYVSPHVFRSPVSSRIPPNTVESVTSSYVLPESMKMNTDADSVLFKGRRPAYEEPATKIPAFPWNKPIPYTSQYHDAASLVSINSSNTTVMKFDRTPSEPWERAKLFKDDKPRIGVEFETDTGDNVLQNDDAATARLVTTQDYLAPPEELSLEIQHGVGPFAPTVISPVKIGDNISLVVRSKSHMKGENAYDMFVHSCFASDGQGMAKIELIDKNGCATRPQFSSELKRTRDPDGVMYYFFRITAFKFPGPDDVYFSCSVDLTPFRAAPEICPAFRRAVREAPSANELRLFDSVKVELDTLMTGRRNLYEPFENDGIWVSNSTLAFAVLLFITLLLAVLVSTFMAYFFYTKLSSSNSSSLGLTSQYA